MLSRPYKVEGLNLADVSHVSCCLQRTTWTQLNQDGGSIRPGRQHASLKRSYFKFRRKGEQPVGGAIVLMRGADKPSARSLTLRRKLPPGAPRPEDGRVGVGISFCADMQGNHVIQQLIEGGSAKQCGEMSVGDIIFAVNGETVAGLPVHNVVDKIKGQEGSEISLVIIKKGNTGSGRNMPLAGTPGLMENMASMMSGTGSVDKEKALTEQLEAVRKMKEEQQQKELIIQAQQQLLFKEQQELLKQKEVIRKMQLDEAQKQRFQGEIERQMNTSQSSSNFAAASAEAVSVKRWEDGKVYKGEFRDGKRNGKGSISYPDGSSYDGEWLNDLRHGQGEYRYADGTHYKGNWEHGNRNGLGMCQYSDGNRYEGEWRSNLPHGAGSCRFQEGSVYKGEFVEGKMHGFGTLYGPDGSVTFQGEWRNGEKVKPLIDNPPFAGSGLASSAYPSFPIASSSHAAPRSLSPAMGPYTQPPSYISATDMRNRSPPKQLYSPPTAHDNPPRYGEHVAVVSSLRPDSFGSRGSGTIVRKDEPILTSSPHEESRRVQHDRHNTGYDNARHSSKQPLQSALRSREDKPTTRCGVGLKLSQEGKGHPIVIEKIQRDGAADLDGRLKTGDIVTRVDGISVSDAENAGILIQGPPGSTVSIVAERQTGSSTAIVQATLQRRSLSIRRAPESHHVATVRPSSRAASTLPPSMGTPPRSRPFSERGPGTLQQSPNDCPTM